MSEREGALPLDETVETEADAFADPAEGEPTLEDLGEPDVEDDEETAEALPDAGPIETPAPRPFRLPEALLERLQGLVAEAVDRVRSADVTTARVALAVAVKFGKDGLQVDSSLTSAEAAKGTAFPATHYPAPVAPTPEPQEGGLLALMEQPVLCILWEPRDLIHPTSEHDWTPVYLAAADLDGIAQFEADHPGFDVAPVLDRDFRECRMCLAVAVAAPDETEDEGEDFGFVGEGGAAAGPTTVSGAASEAEEPFEAERPTLAPGAPWPVASATEAEVGAAYAEGREAGAAAGGGEFGFAETMRDLGRPDLAEAALNGAREPVAAGYAEHVAGKKGRRQKTSA